MRVAFCLSGHLRTFERTWESQLLNIVTPNQCDVFLSTWDVLGNAKHHLSAREEFLRPINQETLKAVYGSWLKDLQIINFNDAQPLLPKFFYPGMVSMFWQVSQANLLRKRYEEQNNFKYDIVIRARPDMHFKTGLEIRNPEALKGVLLTHIIYEHYLNDQFAFGTGEVMDVYCGVFEFLEEYDKIKHTFKPPPGSDVICFPEHVLKLHIDRFGIPIAPVSLATELDRSGYVENAG